MSLMSKLWASIQGDPVFMRRVNGWLAVFWIAMIPVAVMLGWLHSVVYVSALSLVEHWASGQALLTPGHKRVGDGLLGTNSFSPPLESQPLLASAREAAHS